MKSLPYIIYKKSELDRMKLTLNERLGDWSKGWFSRNQDCTVGSVIPFSNVKDLFNNYSSYYEFSLNHSGAQIISCLDKESFACISLLLFGEKGIASSSVALRKNTDLLCEQLVIKMLQDFVSEVLLSNSENSSIVCNKITEVPAHVERTSGSVVISVKFGNAEIDVIVPSQLAELIADRSYKTAGTDIFYDGDLNDLISEGEVAFETILGTANITFEELMSLQVGDVVKLNKKVDEPCSIRFENAQIEYNCLLGKVNGNKAVKVVS